MDRFEQLGFPSVSAEEWKYTNLAALAKRHGLYLIEDCCDAVGATYRGRSVGSFGDVATVSFYPAHHITMGEGGAADLRAVEAAVAEMKAEAGQHGAFDLSLVAMTLPPPAVKPEPMRAPG